MTAKVRVKACKKCGYHVLRSYFQYHTCRPGDTWKQTVGLKEQIRRKARE